MADLPYEVISDILTRLPVIYLLRFRSVCKSWRSLIDNRRFISVHLKNPIHTNLILSNDSDLYQIDFPNLNGAVPLNHPLMCYSNSITLLGSCNGLLCICNVADDIAFWNPSLRKYRILPCLPSTRRSDADASLLAVRVYGFGHESFAGDYKLVRILFLYDWHNRSFESQVKLYSLRTNSWKTLPSMPYALCCARTMGVFVGNALHWVVTRKLEPNQPDLIVAFDLRLEVFLVVPLPEIGDEGNFEIDVALLGGCLCMIVNYQDTRVDVWLMKKYGSKDSWCKVFSLMKSREMRSLKSVRPLGYSSDGSKVLLEQDRKKLFWYNMKDEQVTCVRIPGVHNLNEGMICMGSLVSPSSLGENCRKQRKLGCENTRKRRDDFLSQGFKLTL
ncbi:F-box protein CPR1-like [Gastrolobium bilobum]|uniref:F-box protein CPR1-like n=1 Tax=Gastrolobium bilobum TaxID=150636 RepID=UPI002AB2989C|nr:F-box protein CPR1-like [Gastrolobium bilobum]